MKSINKERIINASGHDVWDAFTTSEGARTFFAPEANIELRLGGPYELYFITDGEYGFRGSEGCKILCYLPEELLSFTWNAPPGFPEERGQHTFVVLQFSEVDDKNTRVRITHAGWREGGKWNEVYAYFERAWDIVLDNLKKRFESGPLWR